MHVELEIPSLPDIPPVEETVGISQKRLAESIKVERDKRREQAFYKEHWIEFIAARALSRVKQKIEVATETGHVSIFCEISIGGDKPSKEEITAVQAILERSLKGYEAEISFWSPDSEFLAAFAKSAAFTGGDFAWAGYHYHAFRGWRIKVSWKTRLMEV